MELRPPPREEDRRSARSWVNALVILAAVGVATWGVIWVGRPWQRSSLAESAERSREVAAKLQAAGALDEAASLYEEYLALAEPPAGTRARIAYSLGTNYMQSGRYDKALRWLYEAETLGGAELGGELSTRIVHCLERLGRHHAAQAALESRVRLESQAVERSEEDPVVARLGQTEIRRSEVEHALEGLPPEVGGGFAGPAGRQQFLKKYVADELLWRKAVKLEYDRDPEVQRRYADALRQLTIARFIEAELLQKIEVDETDLRNFLEANRVRYQAEPEEGETRRQVTLEDVRPLVERDYRLQKLESAYNQLIETELSTQDVQLFPERLQDDR